GRARSLPSWRSKPRPSTIGATRSARSWPSSSSGRSPAEAQARHEAQGGRWLVPRLTITAPMAFNPRTDVVMEVLNAADPSRASLAAQRLTLLAGSNAPAADFSADLERAASSATPIP